MCLHANEYIFSVRSAHFLSRAHAQPDRKALMSVCVRREVLSGRHAMADKCRGSVVTAVRFEFFCVRRVAPAPHTMPPPDAQNSMWVCLRFPQHVFVYLCLGKTV